MAVYYLRADNGAIKIGYSKTPKNRFVELNTASPLNLEIVAYEDGGMDVERKRHQQYRAQGIRGEWFRPCPQLDRHIAKLNPDYVPMPYIDRGEHERISKKLDNISLWFSVNRDSPPKIAHVVTIVCLVIGGRNFPACRIRNKFRGDIDHRSILPRRVHRIPDIRICDSRIHSGKGVAT